MSTDRSKPKVHSLDHATYCDEVEVLQELIAFADLSGADRQQISNRGAQFVRGIRGLSSPGLMETFLAEYGLSTNEGIALMCLAEALLRVPDTQTITALIEDKIAPGDWAKHMGHSTSPLVNASTWALMLTGKVLNNHGISPVKLLRSSIKRLGEPAIRTAVHRAMEIMGRQFVLGENIVKAMARAKPMESNGYTYSYDMLGEAALTNADAERYHLAYSKAMSAIAEGCQGRDIRTNPGISIKLSALFPRYEIAKRDRVLTELVPKVLSLAVLAKSAGMGLTIDAEEADRLSLSMDVITQVLSQSALAGWDGFGVVVQAYGRRAGQVIDTLYQLSQKLDRRITVRLVKGAYWDSEIKQAQVKGLSGFAVFTSKPATDISYIANAKRLLGMTDRIFPQFATHNAHTIAAILHMASDKQAFEFQRLHGMGEQLHGLNKEQENTRCRIYAPVGAHKDLLAYLVRRLLENGANSSFVNQIVNEDVSPETVAADPFAQYSREAKPKPNTMIRPGSTLFQPERPNSYGWDLTHQPTLDEIDKAREPFRQTQWQATPLLASEETSRAVSGSAPVNLYNPANPEDHLGSVQPATEADVIAAVTAARTWDASPEERAKVLGQVADLFEGHFGELFALLAREAGKTLPDAEGELREAVDFLRYYASHATADAPVGTFACISPWNFPLAIFTGQVSAALTAGNGVLAKPAEQTPLIAWRAVQLMHQAGVPKNAIQLLPGDGSIGAMITRNPAIGGVVFTGSTDTAQIIRRTMAAHLSPGAPLIAETGGLNAMMIDSTALPEQAVKAVIESAFQSSGQRCSALRCLYVQEDIAEPFKEMLFGAMDELELDDPWHLSTDCGPVIDQAALNTIKMHVDKAEAENRVLKRLACPDNGTFVGLTVIEIGGIEELDREIFGPVLHFATFRANQIDQIIDNINATGYGLTFGLQTRIDDRVQSACAGINAGNIYVNRNQIGAMVGSQPFGGNGLSGTGPKAGGPHYLARFNSHPAPTSNISDVPDASGTSLCAKDIQQQISDAVVHTPQETINLPGPTGESNRYTTVAREPLLCFGPSKQVAAEQARMIREQGGQAVECGDACSEQVLNEVLSQVVGFSAVVWWGDTDTAKTLDVALSNIDGPLLPLVTGIPDTGHIFFERHICVDTTASGGNAELLMNTSDIAVGIA